MRLIRLVTILMLTALSQIPLASTGLQQQPPITNPDDINNPDKERRLPNGKSYNISAAKEEHERALKDADELISVAQQIKADLEKSGDFVVPVSTVKKTEEIEKIAKRIRGRLRG